MRPALPRLTARSVVLSVLLGAHPAHATAAELIRLTTDFDIKESALRVALTRMVAAGDLVRTEGGYGLSERLLARQARQDDAVGPRVRAWDGTWTTLVLTNVGADARTRALLRRQLQDGRFGELREGVWLRPDNLESRPGPAITGHGRLLRSVDAEPVRLAGLLWDLPRWSGDANDLLDAMAGAADVPARFTVAAAMVRHLLTDPVLPDELLPPHWPGERLRAAYARFATELTGRRDQRSPAGSSA